MVGVPRRPGERQKLWSAGEYTLLADSHITEDRLTYSRGDTFVLDERAATRLGNAGAITPPGGMHAVRARVESGKGSKRDEYLYRMWELAGAWGIEGGPKPPTFFSRLHISRMSPSMLVPPSCSETM